MAGQQSVLLERLCQSGKSASQEKGAARISGGSRRRASVKVCVTGCKTLEMAVETKEIQERYTRKAVRAMRSEEPDVASCLKLLGDGMEALLGEIKED